MPTKTILVVDVDRDLVELISYNLAKESFQVLRAYDCETALKTVKAGRPDLMILDLVLPDGKGLDLCRTLRGTPETQKLPIIILTAKKDDSDKIAGLEAGADDYMTKPFSLRELEARVRALLRRAERNPEAEKRKTFNYQGLSVDYQSYEVRLDGREIEIGPTEMKILMLLTHSAGKVFARRELLDLIWGEGAFIEPRTIDVHISRLRSSLEKDQSNPQYILTVRGVGYKFADSRV